MNIYIVIMLSVLISSSTSFGKARFVPLPEKVEASDLIARIEIMSRQMIKEPTTYRWLAKAKVIEGIKGGTEGQLINLEFDNGNVCPNVWYSQGDDCVIFAVEMENGHYHTYNTYFGKLLVNQLPMPSGEKVSFVHGHALGLGRDSYMVLDEAVLEIKEHIKETDAEQPDGAVTQESAPSAAP